jgi:hypothetical protein
MPPFSASYDYLSDSDLEDASDYLSHKAQPSNTETSTVSRSIEISSSGSEIMSPGSENSSVGSDDSEHIVIVEELPSLVSGSLGGSSDRLRLHPYSDEAKVMDVTQKARLEEKAIPVGDIAYKT